MRKLRILALLTIPLLFHATGLQAQADPEAVAYLNRLSASLDELKGETWQYLKAVTRGKGAKKVENKRQKLLKELQAVKADVKQQKAYQSDNTLKNSVIQYLSLTHTVISEDFGKILNMEEIAEQSYDLMEAYLLAKEKANEKLDSAMVLAQEAQNQFAAKHNITILEGEADKMSRKIQRAGETLSYYNDVYLIFFKSYKQEMYVLDAIQRNDVSALEQNLSALQSFASEGLDNLKARGNYQNDATLRLAAQQILGFYRTEAEKDFASMVDFYIKKDTYEKVQKRFEAISPKKRTQQDIDQYNQAVNEFNEAAEAFNQRNEKTYQQRVKHIDQWNRQVETFLTKHAG